MNLVVAVTGHVHPQLFEVAPLARLPLRMRADIRPAQEERGNVLPLRVEIGIHPHLHARRLAPAHGPESQRRLRFEISVLEKVLAAAIGSHIPLDPRHGGICRQLCDPVVGLRGQFAREGEANAQHSAGQGFIVDAHLENTEPVLLQPHDLGQFDTNPGELPAREKNIDDDQRQQSPDEECGKQNRAGHRRPHGCERQHDERNPEEEFGARDDHGRKKIRNPKSEIRNKFKRSEMAEKRFATCALL